MGNRVDILVEYLKKDPSLLENVKAIMEYRNLRTEQAYHSRISNDYRHDRYDNPIVRKMTELDFDYSKLRVRELDERRRRVHNSALGNYMGLLRFGKDNSLPLLYEGEVLSDDDIKRHTNLVVREKLTDSMLQLLYEIEEVNIKKLRQIEEQQKDIGLSEVSHSLQKESNEYDVKKPLTEDEGDIKWNFDR